MNEELQKALGELLNKANGGIDTAGEFLASELPEVIQQLLMWHGVYSFIVFVLCVITPFVFYKMSVMIANKTFLKGDESFFDHPHIIIPMAAMNAVMVMVVLTKINIVWLQIWIAPKVWLLEYAAKLVG